MTSLVADMHGTTLAAVPNGSWKKTSVIKQYTDPFGATRGTAVTVPGDRQFLDRTRDSTGLTLIGARYYDEHTGRFISLDPLLDLSDPQQWNGYAYANNNPTSLSDPTGLAVSVSIEDDGSRAPGRASSVRSRPARQARWTPGPSASSATRSTARSVSFYEPPPAPDTCPTACTPLRPFMSPSEMGHLLVEGVGLVPGLELADAANAGWYALEGNWEDAGLSALSMVPVAGWAANVAKWARRAANATVDGADNVANGARLSQQLARESAESVFTSSGRLSPEAIAESREIISGADLSTRVIRHLTSDGSDIADWGKYTTPFYRSPSGDFQVHFYMNRVTGAIDYEYDYKVKFRGAIF
ncbi:RHS repeat-associated core domain-containing protein [Cellulomonas sp. CW35]|uniref:RHS repeat-associated core domain-containing protein n=1 Tax=Cellulomonas sp. CW35 TaxID=3458249 RepID=UPI004034634F